MGCAIDRREHSAQGLVADNHIAQCRAQGVGVERPADAERRRHVVGRDLALDLIEKPHPVLSERQRHHRRPLVHCYQRIAPTRPLTDARRQPRDRGCIEQRTHGDIGVQIGVDRRDHPHRRQRVATQIEERVVDTDPFDAEDPRVYPGQDLLDGVRRGAVRIRILILRSRQGAPIEFAVDRQGQRVDADHRRRHHISGQSVRQCTACPRRINGPGDVTDQTLVTGTVLAGNHDRLVHPGNRSERSLNLAEFDPIPADLDLLIGSTQVAQFTVGAPADQIACAIHPLSRCSRVNQRACHEPR
nr:hypothetical protein CPGR_04138 [Mycolicibacterium malmesburyense]